MLADKHVKLDRLEEKIAYAKAFKASGRPASEFNAGLRSIEFKHRGVSPETIRRMEREREPTRRNPAEGEGMSMGASLVIAAAVGGTLGWIFGFAASFAGPPRS